MLILDSMFYLIHAYGMYWQIVSSTAIKEEINTVFLYIYQELWLFAAPNAKMQEVLKKTGKEAKDMISKVRITYQHLAFH